MGIVVNQFNFDFCYSYIIWDENTRHSIIVDPVYELCDMFSMFIHEKDLKLIYIIDTHTHSDHYSGSLEVKKRHGGIIRLSEKSTSIRQDMPLTDNEKIYLNDNCLQVHLIPGHTPDSLILISDDFVMTGDTLLIDGLGRTDLVQSSSDDLFMGISSKILNLKADTILYPGHDYNNHLFSTIEIEKNNFKTFSKNNLLKPKKQSPDEYKLISDIENYNLSLTVTPKNDEKEPIMCCSSMNNKKNRPIPSISVLEANSDFDKLIDIREDFELELHSIPGVKHIPMSSLGKYFSLVEFSEPVLFICSSGFRSQTAQQTFSYLGIQSKNVSGGIHAWNQAGLPII